MHCESNDESESENLNSKRGTAEQYRKKNREVDKAMTN